MNRIKDFFYNKNDIIIVLVILAVAGLLIYNRIGAIMDYPAKLAEQNAKTETTEQVETTTTETEEQSTEADDDTGDEATDSSDETEE